MITAPARRRGPSPPPRLARCSRCLGLSLCFAVAAGLWARQAAARAAIESAAHPPAPVPPPIGVIAPAGSRLAGELKREITAANLTSVSMIASDRDWPAEMTDLVSLPYLQGVVVGSDDGRMIVFSRGAASGRVEVRFELRFDPNDRPARRRACLAVVESLRVLGDTSSPPPPSAEGTDPPSSEGSAAGTPAPGAAATAIPGGGPAATPGPAAGAGAATLEVAGQASAQARVPPGSASPASAHPLTVASAAPESSTAIAAPVPAGGLTRAPAIAVVAPLSEDAPPAHEPWVMGVATMLDVDHTLGAPMGHLQFVWLIPIGERFAFRVQAMWPLMGTQLRADGSDARIWTFGAALGLHYLFTPPQARVRPFVGLATGSQILLTDTSGVDTDKGRALFVTSANLRVQSGVRYTIASRVQLLAELEATRDWLIQSRQEPVYRDSVANTVAFHASLGVLFEY